MTTHTIYHGPAGGLALSMGLSANLISLTPAAEASGLPALVMPAAAHMGRRPEGTCVSLRLPCPAALAWSLRRQAYCIDEMGRRRAGRLFPMAGAAVPALAVGE
jgi:hypothetical protein